MFNATHLGIEGQKGEVKLPSISEEQTHNRIDVALLSEKSLLPCLGNVASNQFIQSLGLFPPDDMILSIHKITLRRFDHDTYFQERRGMFKAEKWLKGMQPVSRTPNLLTRID